MSKFLVAYFSAGGRTAKAAKLLAEAAGADLYEIKPAVPYTRSDLSWINKKSRSSLEMRDKACRPELSDHDAGVEKYDAIFLGFPIWWFTAPRIIRTFLESYDFSEKTVILFATSGGSNLGSIDQELQSSVPRTCTVKNGRMLNGRQKKDDLAAWVRRLHL